jgi:hypothetical protein
MPNTLAAVERAARIVKRLPGAANKYPVSRRVGRRSLAALASVAAVFALPAAAQAGVVTEFTSALTAGNAPAAITAGPDGDLWFTANAFPGRIGRVGLAPVAELALTQKELISPGRHEVTDGELQAIVTPNSQDTTYHVEYGPDESYGSESAESARLTGAEAVTEPVELPLDPSSHYHARLVAANASGEAVSADVPLWTDADGHISDYDVTAPVVDAGPTPTPTPTPTATPAPTATPEAHGNFQQAHDEHGPAATPAADLPVAPPVLGESVVVHPLRGSVRVKAAGAKGYQLAREAKGKRRVVRRLWGRDNHSRFRTHGRDSVATVRGTRWVTTDRCDGTLTRVTQGKVSVRDLRRKRSVLVSAGHAYLARHRHHRRH